MDVWGWLVGYLVLFALVHVVLYYVYVHRSDDERAGSSAVPDGNGAWPSPRREHATERVGVSDPAELERTVEFDGRTVDCSYCGATNESDPAFTRCWNCLSTLR